MSIESNILESEAQDCERFLNLRARLEEGTNNLGESEKQVVHLHRSLLSLESVRPFSINENNASEWRNLLSHFKTFDNEKLIDQDAKTLFENDKIRMVVYSQLVNKFFEPEWQVWL